MGILDDTLQGWGLGLLNGGAAPTQAPAQWAPFGFTPMADGASQQARAQLAAQQQNSPLPDTGDSIFGDHQTAYARRQYRLARQGLPPDFGNRVYDISSKLLYGAAQGLVTLPQRAMDAARESIGHDFGAGPATMSDSDPPWQDPLPSVAAETAMTMMGGRVPFAERGAVGAAKTMESRSSRLYDPPVKPARPFEADYPGGGIADEAGRLKFDIDGLPLIGAHISGRRMVRGADEPLLPKELAAVSEGSIGASPKAHPAGELPKGSVGFYREVRGPDGPERSIGYLKTLTPPAAAKVVSHELGHAFDELSGQIPTDGLNTELRQLYNTLNTGQERTTRLTGPQHMGYGDEETPRELMAEAIRAYMTNPNYIKTVAPQTAARIREYANQNPRTNRTIQFNSGGAPFLVPPNQTNEN